MCAVHKMQAEKGHTFSTRAPQTHSRIAFTVLGTPATKGSTVSFLGDEGQIITRTDSQRLRGWSQSVADAAREAQATCAPKPTPVRIMARFVFAAPASAPARAFHVVRPDIDKVSRALLDALTGVCYEDDSQVIDLRVQKTVGPITQTFINVEIVS